MGLTEWIAAILGGIAINLIASELFAWGPRLSDWLTRWAVRRLPDEMQERMRDEWAGHLDALHALSRTVAAIGFVLAAYRISVSFNRNSRGALTIHQWLSPKPLIVVVMTERLATSMARTMSETINVQDNQSDAVELDGGPEDFLVRLNLVAHGRKLLRLSYTRILWVFGKERRTLNDYVSNASRNSSGDIVIESAGATWLIKIRLSIRR